MASEIQKVRETVELQLRQTDEVVASNEAIADAISEVNYALESGFFCVGLGSAGVMLQYKRRFPGGL